MHVQQQECACRCVCYLFLGKVNGVYISSETTAYVCEVSSRQTGVKEEIRMAMKEQNHQNNLIWKKRLLIYSITVQRLSHFVNKCVKIKMEPCGHKCNSMTRNHGSFTDTGSSPCLLCPFSLWSLSIMPYTDHFIWKTLLMCSDKHIACKRDSLLKHMARMFHLLKVFLAEQFSIS